MYEIVSAVKEAAMEAEPQFAAGTPRYSTVSFVETPRSSTRSSGQLSQRMNMLTSPLSKMIVAKAASDPAQEH